VSWCTSFVFVNNDKEVFYTIRVKETIAKKKRYFLKAGRYFAFMKGRATCRVVAEGEA